MSNVVFPTLPGIKWDQKKIPIFNTITQRSVNLKEQRICLSQYPIYEYELSYELLRDNVANNELENLMGFYLSRQGAYDSFLYVDPSDYYVTTQGVGTGDGATKAFQLYRTYGVAPSQWIDLCTDIQPPVTGNTNIIKSWAQGSPAYDTLTSNGANITSAIWSSGSGTKVAQSANLALTAGASYVLVATVTHTSGQYPYLSMGTAAGGAGDIASTLLTAGVNTFNFNYVTANANYLYIKNTAAASNAITFTLYLITPSFNVYLAGVLQNPASYSVVNYQSGIMTFTNAPLNGVAITVDFSYYRRVRFVEYTEGGDGFNEFMNNLWELKKVTLIQDKL